MTRRVERSPSGVRAYFRERLGVAEGVWEPYRLRVGNSSVFVRGPDRRIDLDWQQEETGLRIASVTTDAFKPSTRGIQWLGHRVRRNRIPLDDEALRVLLKRRTTRKVDTERVLDRGYVAVFYREWALGCCFWTGDRLRTQLPKGLTRHFPEAILETPSGPGAGSGDSR